MHGATIKKKHLVLLLQGILNTLRMGDADLRLYAYKQFKYPVPNVLRCHGGRDRKIEGEEEKEENKNEEEEEGKEKA
jgi:hypothetical protein